MADITLHYFPIFGRGEVIRMIFHYHGVKFNDHRVQMQEWPGLKTSGFAEFDTLPILEIDGLRLVQSHAITRYVCQRYGYYPSLPEHTYLLESLCDLKEDILRTISPFMFKGETEALEKWFQDNAQTMLEQIERRLPRGARYFVANAITMADFMIFQLIHDYFLLRNRGDLVKRHAPNVFQFVHRFLDSSTTLKTYVDSRPLCPV